MPKEPKPKAKPKEPGWKNRIVGYGTADPAALRANPNNWRVHPVEQNDALLGVLDRVGWVQNVVINKRTGNLVDGHLRVALSIKRGEHEVPVTFVDLSEEEEKVVLVSLDTVAAMASLDSEMLRGLLEEVGGDEALSDGLIRSIHESLTVALTESGGDSSFDSAYYLDDEAVEEKVNKERCPACGQTLKPGQKVKQTSA